jgi:hypothetical protein
LANCSTCFLNWLTVAGRRYLFTEWEDPEFGGRASAVHSGLVNALAGAGRVGEAVWLAIRRQTDMMSQLAYITKELKVCTVLFCLLGTVTFLNTLLTEALLSNASKGFSSC